MRFWLQYHSYDNLGYLPGRHEAGDAELSALDTSGFEPSCISTSKRAICEAVGDTAFFIVGYGGRSKKYLLWSWCVIEDYEETEDGYFNGIPGSGHVLNPPALLAGPEFDEFKRWNANFSLGFRNISEVAYLSHLIALAREFGHFGPMPPGDALRQHGPSTAAIGNAATAADTDGSPPARVPSTISRIVRDTQVAGRVKGFHNHECQLCGHTILKPDGSRYAEGHHIQPLGTPHDGPDTADNVLCLCPNCHVECDLGAIPLVAGKLRLADGHTVGVQYLNYHNRVVYRGSA